MSSEPIAPIPRDGHARSRFDHLPSNAHLASKDMNDLVLGVNMRHALNAIQADGEEHRDPAGRTRGIGKAEVCHSARDITDLLSSRRRDHVYTVFVLLGRAKRSS